MKIVWSLLLALSFAGASLVHAHDASETETLTSPAAFRQLMRNPLLRDYFTYVQQELIATRFDSRLRDFFSQTPVVRDLYQLNVDLADKSLEQFVANAQTQMIRLTKSMGSEQGRQIYRMVVALAKAQGFPDEAINEINIYVADGPKNAFTVNASKSRIIIVFQSQMLSTMSLSEVRAVIGHELGHIVLGHTTLQRMHMFMINLLHSLFVRNSASGVPLQKMHNAEMQIFAELLRRPQTLYPLVLNYLNLVLEGMDEYLAPASSVAVMRSFRDDLTAVMQDPSRQGFIRPTDLQVFSHAVTDMMNAISRSQEVSSDRISDSVVRRDYLASAFIRILGLDKFDVHDRSQLIQQVVDQAEEELNTRDRSSLEQNIGVTHPSSILRIYLMTQMPHYPSVVIANPFARLLALNQYTLMDRALSKFAVSQAPSSPQDEAKQLADHFEEVNKASEQTMTTILTLLSSRNIDQKHPRLTDVIQYSLIQREQQLHQIKELEEKIPTIQHPQMLKIMQQRLEMAKTVFLPEGAEFLNRVVQLLTSQPTPDSELKTARLKALHVAATSLDLEEVRQVRQELLQLDPSRHWTKDPIADLNAPNFIVPRETARAAQEPEAKSHPNSLSLLKVFNCEQIIRDGSVVPRF